MVNPFVRDLDRSLEKLRGGGLINSPALLSTLHIPPFFEYYTGASLLKVSKGGVGKTPIGGIKQQIYGFSRSSRRRLMRVIAQVRRDAPLPNFVTLTYPFSFPTPEISKRHLDIFLKRLRRRFPGVGNIWKLEPQQRGAPHYHLLVWGVDLRELRAFVPQAWFEIAGKGDILHLKWHRGELGNGNKPCVAPVRTWRGVWAYAAKYLGKTFLVAGWETGTWTGRYWGVIAPENIPFGELENVKIELPVVIQILRYQRRFAHLRGRDQRSLTIFCNADYWVRRLLVYQFLTEEGGDQNDQACEACLGEIEVNEEISKGNGADQRYQVKTAEMRYI